MEISAALLQGFRNNTNSLHILAPSSRDFCSRIGLRVDYSFFVSKELERTLVAKFLGGIWRAEGTSYPPFLNELASLDDPPLEEIINSGILPKLTKTLDYASLCLLSKLVQGSSDDCVRKIVRSGFVSGIGLFLLTSNGSYDELKECCIALKRIANISYLRNEILQYNYDVLKALGNHSTSPVTEIRQICMDTLKFICCNNEMPPLDFNRVNLPLSTATLMLASEDHALIVFASSFISLQIRSTHLRLSCYVVDILKNVLEILCQDSDQQLLPALELLSQFPECYLFSDALSDLKTHMVSKINSSLAVLSKYLNNESEKVVLQACKSISFLLRFFCRKDYVLYTFKRRDILLQWVDSVAKVCHVEEINPWHEKLLLSSNELEKDDVIKMCHEVEQMIKLCADNVEEELRR
jgi:hypothetical protein